MASLVGHKVNSIDQLPGLSLGNSFKHVFDALNVVGNKTDNLSDVLLPKVYHLAQNVADLENGFKGVSIYSSLRFLRPNLGRNLKSQFYQVLIVFFDDGQLVHITPQVLLGLN